MKRCFSSTKSWLAFVACLPVFVVGGEKQNMPFCCLGLLPLDVGHYQCVEYESHVSYKDEYLEVK